MIFLLFNIFSLISIAIFFILGYTLFLRSLYFEYFLIYQDQFKFFVGNLDNLLKIGLSGVFVFLINLFLGVFLRRYRKKEANLVALSSLIYQIFLLIFEIQVYFLNF